MDSDPVILVQNTLPKIVLAGLSSSKLALLLVLLVMLLSLVGAVLPQQGGMEPAEIAQWQKTHPNITRILGPAGMFHVFHSWPFLVTIFVLAVNTLTCTILRFVKEGLLSALKGPAAVERAGFLLLHLSLIVLFVGGFCTAATGLDGHIVLTQGQRFTEQHDQYRRLVEGPLRPEHHKQFSVVLADVQTWFEGSTQVDAVATLEIFAYGRKLTGGVVKYNKPFSHEGVDFTLRDTGFSPRIVIRESNSGAVRVNSYVALKTFQTQQGSQYRDFLPLPFLNDITVLTLYPSHSFKNGSIVKTGEQPDNPILLIETKNRSGQIISSDYLPMGKQVTVGDFDFAFTDLRRWSAFRIVEDDGYPIVWAALCLGTAALLLRYLPELYNWLGPEEPEPDKAAI